MIQDWAPGRAWCPEGNLEVVGAFRFDDPEGRVGMETHVAAVGDTFVLVPLTYREAPLEGADDAFIGEMHHSALGTRWVYDGLGDPTYLVMLAAVSLTGQGEALGLVEVDGRWHIAPANVRIQGGGFGLDRVPVDGMELVADGVSPQFRSDGFEMTVHRQPTIGPRPTMGLTAHWDGLVESVVLTEVRARS